MIASGYCLRLLTQPASLRKSGLDLIHVPASHLIAESLTLKDDCVVIEKMMRQILK